MRSVKVTYYDYEYFKLYSELPILLGIILLSHSARVCMLRTNGEHVGFLEHANS